MKQPLKHNIHRLAIRVSGPIVVGWLILICSVYFFIQSVTTKFMSEKIEADLMWFSRHATTICSMQLDDLLKSGSPEDANSILIYKNRAIVEIDQLIRESTIEGFIVSGNGDILLSPGLPMTEKEIKAAISEGHRIIEMRIGSKVYYSSSIYFSHWGWTITLFEPAEVYSILKDRISMLYIIIAGVFFGVLAAIIILLNKSVNVPINQIIRHLSSSEKPEYRGILEIEYLSNAIYKMMTSLEDLNRNLEGIVKERTLELVEAKKQAEESSNAKSVFLARMSHELRTPLNSILGYAQLMGRNTSMGNDEKHQLDIINNSGRHLLSLINDILEISKIESGKTTLENVTFNLKSLIQDLESLFYPGISAKGLELIVTGTELLPQYIKTDESKLRQIIINLLGNAVKFTDQGQITLRFSMDDTEPEAMQFNAAVEDTGPGIAVDELDKIFDSFEQSQSGIGQASGTGLGLTISRNFAHMMGGELHVTSQVGKGSIFRFHIRVQPGSKADVRELIEKKPDVVGLKPGQAAPRILVVEDTRENRDMLVKLLTTIGFKVREAVDGREAIALFNEWHPDFIWMDIRMPVMDGMAAAQQIRQTEKGKTTVIVAVTAHALIEQRNLILGAGFDDILNKPFQASEVFEIIKRHLNIEYVYHSETESPEPDPGFTDHDLKELAGLSEGLLEDLYNATLLLDTESILKTIDQIAKENERIADLLRNIALTLDYDRLHRVLSRSGYNKS